VSDAAEISEPASSSIDLAHYDFALPAERIAQLPCEPRDASKLLVLDRAVTSDAAPYRHTSFDQLCDHLEPGDLLVLNVTRVRPARLRGHRESGGAVEALLLGPVPSPIEGECSGPRFRALLKLSGRLRAGISLTLGPPNGELCAQIISVGERGESILEFAPGADPYSVGEPPLPPYIRRPKAVPEDRDRYQTIYASEPGAIAAPTAGLHFSESLFRKLAARGIETAEVVLHVGPGTFRPLDDQSLREGRLHSEHYELPEETARAIARTRERGGRVIAVGTTSVRVLESCACGDGQVAPGSGETDIFLRPGSSFGVVDGLITNFHLPRSSLLLLVAAFAGRENILAAYAEAIAQNYRFYSYGDAMLIG
jgi:S-adenosylmethionine:tRNA ribosyltransferase-isomerase